MKPSLKRIFIPETAGLILLFILVNSLFIYKYGVRQELINPLFIIIAYPFCLFLLLFIAGSIRIPHRYLDRLYAGLVIILFLFSVAVNLHVDGAALNVDRWSALDSAISSLLNGQYPYMATDHLGGRSSHLTTLLLIGIPFHLLGDVGYLQSFSFLFFAWVIRKTISNRRARIVGIMLLWLSVSWLWELWVKSDLMSNFLIVTGIICLWQKGYPANQPGKIAFLGALSALMLFTRMVVVIPLLLFLLKGFSGSSLRGKIIFLGSSLVTSLLLVFMVMKDYPGGGLLAEYNPLILQSGQLPMAVGVMSVIITIPFAYKVTSQKRLINYSVLLLSVPVIISFAISMVRYGFGGIINDSAFDISYFNIFIPFLIISVTRSYDEIWSADRL